MIKFSPQITKFFEQTGVVPSQDVSIVPKSDSCAKVADFVILRYSLGVGKGSREERLFLVLEPVTKDAKTGNLLLTGIRVPLPGDYTPASLVTLYKNKELPRENYRTYILSKVYGPLRRLNRGRTLLRLLQTRGR